MKTNKILATGIIVATLTLVLATTGCQTAPMTAKSTLEPMRNVGQLTSVNRKTTVGTNGVPIIEMVESSESPEKGQQTLKLAEIEARTRVGVAKAKAKSRLVVVDHSNWGVGVTTSHWVTPAVQNWDPWTGFAPANQNCDGGVQTFYTDPTGGGSGSRWW